ncbi:MAG: HAMP domain-containing sensor histidine kinase [Archangium sp.]
MEGAIAAQSARATETAIRVRMAGVGAFLPLLALLHFMGSPGWDAYLAPLSIFGVIAAALFVTRHRPWMSDVGPFTFVLDVVLVFEMQRRAMPGSPFPAGVAGFSLGLFTLLAAMTASTMRRAATWAVTGVAIAAQVTLMRLATVGVGAQITAAVVLVLLAVTQTTVGRRLREMVRSLANAETEWKREHAQVAELTEARKQIETLLEQAQSQNQALRSLQGDKDALTSLLIHDLRAPLGALRSNIDWLKTELSGSDDPDITDALVQSRQVTDRVTGMIGDLLNINRLESGDMPFTPEERPSRMILEALQRQLQAQGRERRIEVQLDADDSLLNADHGLLQRALENISSNALRYTPAGGTIRIEGRARGPEVHFAIRNSGPAIPPNVRATLFEKYVQAGSAQDNRRAGWGLGLYFCKLCVEAHQGFIGLEDVDGWPTSFVIRVPAAIDARIAA